MQRRVKGKLVRTAGSWALAAALALGLSASAGIAHGQTAVQKQRTLDGSVRDAAGQPLAGAIVYLKNMTSFSVKTYVTAADGNFRFGQVGMDADYEVYAEAAGKKSKVKRISAFDNKKRWTLTLTVD